MLGGHRDRLFEGVGSSDLDLRLHPPPPPKPESLWSWPLPHQSRFGEGVTATSFSLLPYVLLNGFLHGYSVLKSLLLDPWNQSPVSGPSPTSLLDAGNRGGAEGGGKEREAESLAFPRDDRRGRKESAVTHVEPAWLPGCLPHSCCGCHLASPSPSPTSLSRARSASRLPAQELNDGEVCSGVGRAAGDHGVVLASLAGTWPGESLLLPEPSTFLCGCKQALPFLGF